MVLEYLVVPEYQILLNLYLTICNVWTKFKCLTVRVVETLT